MSRVAQQSLAAEAVSASVVGVLAVTTLFPASPAHGGPQLAISVASTVTLGPVTARDEDILLRDLVSSGLGSTRCNWSLLFDGSIAGLNSNVRALDVLPNGSLVIRVGAGLDGETIQALSSIKDDDGVPDGLDNCPGLSNPGKRTPTATISVTPAITAHSVRFPRGATRSATTAT